MSVEPEPAAARRLLSAEAPPARFARALSGVTHAFFGRQGGVSTGIYASLNAGPGSNDDARNVRVNRATIAHAMRVAPDRFLSMHQVHSARAEIVSGPWPGAWPELDGVVTTSRGLALGVLSADCAPILFADVEAGVIGAAHAGWKGAIGGVIEATVAKMREAGARTISAAIGPTIQQASYEVGPEFHARFVESGAANAGFFRPGVGDRFHFDLPDFCAHRLAAAGVANIESLGDDTCADAERYFSNRRAVLRAEGDYGRNCAAIALL